ALSLAACLSGCGADDDLLELPDDEIATVGKADSVLPAPADATKTLDFGVAQRIAAASAEYRVFTAKGGHAFRVTVSALTAAGNRAAWNAVAVSLAKLRTAKGWADPGQSHFYAFAADGTFSYEFAPPCTRATTGPRCMIATVLRRGRYTTSATDVQLAYDDG